MNSTYITRPAAVLLAQGGLWKSEDGGREWKPLFDEQATQSLGSFAIGLGIWKSLDVGQTWEHVWKTYGQIGQMIVHPTNPDIAFAAVLGSPFGPSATRGIYRTQDGGKTWQRVLYKDVDTGASDVVFDPNNSNILFAGLWQMRRSPWQMTSGGPGSGLWRSADGGSTWTELKENGLPPGDWGKVGVAVAASNSNRVYALIEAKEGGLFRSDDGGAKWERINEHRSLRQRHWYYTVLTVDPTNADVIWFPQVPLLKSVDGNDGGVDISFDGGRSWFDPPLPTGQFYNIDVGSNTASSGPRRSRPRRTTRR